MVARNINRQPKSSKFQGQGYTPKEPRLRMGGLPKKSITDY